MTRWSKFIACGLVAALVGCGEKNDTKRDNTWRPLLKNPPIQEVKLGKPMSVPEMQPDDVIVAVNGIGLTKKELDDKLLAYDWYLRRDRRIHAQQRQIMYKNYGRRLIPSFIETQALLWEAREKCKLEYTNIVAVVETNVIRNAKHYGVSPKQYDKYAPGGNYAVRQAAEHLLWRQTYLDQCFKPTTIITDEKVTNVIKQINSENDMITASNAVVRARLEAIRKRIVVGGEDFGKLADEFGEDPTQEKDGTGLWGEIARTDITADVAIEKIFALKTGEVSEILEENEGYFIVKALAEPKLSKDGKTQTIKLARIWLERTPLVVLADAASLKKDLQRQVNAREITRHIRELCKKVKVVYPHGTNFWNKTK